MKQDEVKICGLCKGVIAKGTGYWLHPNPFGIKYVHQSCHENYRSLGESFIRSMKK